LKCCKFDSGFSTLLCTLAIDEDFSGVWYLRAEFYFILDDACDDEFFSLDFLIS
jgi:hypothetical protein